MTREEAIDSNKNLRMYMKLSDKNQPCKFLEENYIALDMAIKSLEAWDKVEADILGLDGYYDDAFWEGVYTVSKIIGKHLAEVKNE